MDLHRRQIRRAEWVPFIERFSRAHRGWRVRIGVVDTCLMRSAVETTAREVDHDALFEGLRLDERSDGQQLSVLIGLPNALTTHAVRAPRRIYVEQTAAGVEEALRVDAGDGTSLLLQFPSAAAPDQTDGVSAGELGPRQ